MENPLSLNSLFLVMGDISAIGSQRVKEAYSCRVRVLVLVPSQGLKKGWQVSTHSLQTYPEIAILYGMLSVPLL